MPARVVEREVVRDAHGFLSSLAFVEMDTGAQSAVQTDLELNATLRGLCAVMREWHRHLCLRNGEPDPYAPPPPPPPPSWWRRALRAVGVGRA